MALTYSSNLIKAFFSECKLCKACVSQPFLISLSLRSRSSPWWIQLAFRPEFQLGFWSYAYQVCWLFLLNCASLHLPGKLQSMQTGLFFDGIGLRDVILVLVEHSVHWARPERVWRSASLLPSPEMCVVPASAPKFWQIDWLCFIVTFAELWRERREEEGGAEDGGGSEGMRLSLAKWGTWGQGVPGLVSHRTALFFIGNKRNFPQVETVFPLLVLGWWPPCLCLHPWAFSPCFLSLTCWRGEWERGWVGVWQPAKVSPPRSHTSLLPGSS